MRILKHDKLKFVIFAIGIIMGIMGGCSSKHGRTLILQSDVNYHESKVRGYLDVTTILRFLKKTRSYAGTYEVKITIFYKNPYTGTHVLSKYGYFATLHGDEGEVLQHTRDSISADALPAGCNLIWAGAVLIKVQGGGPQQLFLQSPGTKICVGNGGGGGTAEGDSIEAITKDTIVIAPGEVSDIPYSLPILFRTFYHGSPQNGVKVKLDLDLSGDNVGYLAERTATSGSFLDTSGIVKAVFESYSYSTGEVTVFAKVENDTVTNPWELDFVKIRVIDDNEESHLGSYDCNGHPCTHRKESYPNGPEIKGDGIDDNFEAGVDWDEKNVLVEIDTVKGWRGDYADADLNIIMNVAEFTLEHAVYANTDWLQGPTDYTNKVSSGIDVRFDPLGAIEDEDYDEISSISTAKSILSYYRDDSNAIHVIITSRGTGELGSFGATLSYFPFKGDSGDADSVEIENHLNNPSKIRKALFPSLDQPHKDSVGCLVFYGINDTLNITVHQRDTLVGIALAHEIGHALGMTHVCDINLAKKDNKRENWYFVMYQYFYGNVMYPEIYGQYPSSMFTLMSHFLLQSLEDSNDWKEAQDTTDIENTHFKHILGHPGLCTRDVLGIDNATRALKGYLMAVPWIFKKNKGVQNEHFNSNSTLLKLGEY